MFEILSPPSTLPTPELAVDPDESTLAAWVERADPDAFARLVALHQDYVHRVALSVLGPAFEADAEDVVQEVFLRVAARLKSFRGESRFKTWLHRLTLNVALDRRRRPRWRKPHVDASVLENRPVPNEGGDAFSLAAADERAGALRQYVEDLPDSLRTVIHLRYWLDLSLEEIAETLQMPLGTVKSHLHRGRALLYERMQARGFQRVDAAGSSGWSCCPVST